MSQNKFGKISKLDLELSQASGKTILSQVEFTAPFKIMRPFYGENQEFSLMIMNSSAGIMAGDCQEISVLVREGAKGKLFSQSYEKIHKMDEGFGERNCQITVKSGGFLHYAPLPTLPYGGSSFRGKTEICLESGDAGMIYSEILASGRVTMGEMFQYRSYESEILVTTPKQLLYRDKLKYQPQKMNLSGFCQQEGFSHQSTLLVFHLPVPEDLEEVLVEILASQEKVTGSFTKTHFGDLVFRFLANSAEDLENIQEELVKLVQI